MKPFEVKTFTIPELTGISAKNVEEHLKLYAGYVKHANLIAEKITELSADSEKNAYLIGELQRRFGFEFNGMRNHEYFFSSLEGGPKPLAAGQLQNLIEAQFGSFDAWKTRFTALALTRGVGWAVMYFDKQTGSLVLTWVEEQHLGQLLSLSPVLMLDMWEHAYVYDFATSEKKKYVEAFFQNLNWEVIEQNLSKAIAA